MVNRKETNLDGVKAMARTLLYTDINKTAYSPIVVQHPFTNTGFTMVMRNGEPQCIDITQHFTEVIAEGIKYQEAWEKEQEQLMKTVRGQIMKYPSCVFEIMTPDGKARLSPHDIKMLLSGETNTVVIDDCNYAAFELLDQEVLEMQVDIFDDSRIRMKTGGYEEPDFEMTM